MVAALPSALGAAREIAAGQVAGDAEAYAVGDALGGAAQAVLVAEGEGGDGGAAANVEGADQLLRVELVVGGRQQVDVQMPNRDGHFSDEMGGVREDLATDDVGLNGELGGTTADPRESGCASSN
ncbi:MAG: hypothetical protein IV100_19040 [Myxococcales bacterium]|nr:hypothetical protein [Myxococcales bacterium]